MEYRKITNFLDNTQNQSTKFGTKDSVEIDGDVHGTYNTNSQTEFKNLMFRSSLCDSSDTYILVKGTILVTNTVTAAAPNNRNKKVIFKNCAPFDNCIVKINNTEIDYAKDIDVVMPLYNLIEYSSNYSKTSGSLWQYYRHEPFIGDDRNITDIPDLDTTSINYKQKVAGQTGNNGRKDVQILVPLRLM